MIDQTKLSNLVRQDIQQLRGLAILLVVAYHAGGVLPSGFVGVDVFFVVSGFVVTSSILRKVNEGQFSFSHFVGQRVRRILPALAFMLVIVVSLSTLLSPILARVQTVRTGVFAAFGSANLFLFRFRPDGYFVSSEKSNALLHTWSLSLEEQFYLLFGFAVFLIVRLAKKSTFVRVATVLGLVIASLSFAMCLAITGREVPISSSLLVRVLGADSLDAQFAFYMPITRAWEFLIGVLLALRGSLVHQKQVVVKLLQIVGVCMVLSAGVFTPERGFPGIWTLLPTFGAGAIILGGSPGDEPLGRLGRVFSWLGDRSYGWYLWHWPLIQFLSPFSTSKASLALAAVAALVPAALSFRLLEQPIRNQTHWRSRSRTGWLAVVSVLAPLTAAGLTRHPEPSLDHHLDVRRGCMYGEIEKLNEGGPCTLPTRNSRGTAALIGDSHASHLSEAFVGASHGLGLDALLASRANSPFLYLDDVAIEGKSDEQRTMVDHLIRRKVQLVVVAQSTYPVTFRAGSDWGDAMRPVLDELSNAGIRVVLVAESIFVGVDPQDCSALQIYLSQCAADVEKETSQLLGQRGRIQEEIELVSEFGSVVLFDSAPLLCPDESCAIRRDGQWWWRDESHISVHASKQLENPLRAAMASALESES